MEVPTKKSLAEIYPEDALEKQTKRWNSLISEFKQRYGRLPDFVSRSPGRVNLIGEVGGRVLRIYPYIPSFQVTYSANKLYSTSTTRSTK